MLAVTVVAPAVYARFVYASAFCPSLISAVFPLAKLF